MVRNRVGARALLVTFQLKIYSYVYRNGYLVNKIHLYIWRNTVARKIKSIVCHFGESYGTTAEIVQNTAADIYRK